LGKQRVIVGIRAPSQDELWLIGGLVVDRAEVRLDDDDLVTSQFDGKKRVRLLQDSPSLRVSTALAIGELDASLASVHAELKAAPVARPFHRECHPVGAASFAA
jgi:hypothetical protein